MHLKHLNSIIHPHYKNVHLYKKNVALIKTFFSDSTNILCPSIIDNYIKRPNYLSNISFIEFVANYDIVNLREKKENISYNFLHAL